MRLKTEGKQTKVGKKKKQSNRSRTKVNLLLKHCLNRTDTVNVETSKGKIRRAELDNVEAGVKAHVFGTKAPAVTACFHGKRGDWREDDYFRLGSFLLDKNSKTKFMVIDVDGGAGHSCAVKNPRRVARIIQRNLKERGIPTYLEKSKSGAGWHVWSFFETKIDGGKACKLGRSVIPKEVPLENGGMGDTDKSQGVEIFPKQEKLQKQQVGSAISLPFFHGDTGGKSRFYRRKNGKLQAFLPLKFRTVSEELVDKALASIPDVQPDIPKPDMKPSKMSPKIKEWREKALAALPLEEVYGEYLTGKRLSGGWLGCRDPESPTGDRDPSACVADTVDGFERGLFHSYRDNRTMSVFDFMVSEGKASSMSDAYCVVAQLSDVPLPGTTEDLLTVLVTDRHLRDIVHDCNEVIFKVNEDKLSVFAREDHLVRLRHRYSGPEIQPFDKDLLYNFFVHNADWMKMKPKGGMVPTKPDKDALNAIFRNPPEQLPELTRVTRLPVFDSDGELIRENGYHEKSASFVAFPDGWNFESISMAPSTAELNEAKSLFVDDLLIDFPLKGVADRAHAMAGFLFPFVRKMIDGPTPLLMIEAPTPGSGKSFLSSIIGLIHTGMEPECLTLPNNDEEIRKKITSELSRCPSMVVLDNIDFAETDRKISSSSLAALLTSRRWSDRILGSSKIVTSPNEALWVATGNNPMFSTELARRQVRCRLEPNTADPWTRSDFKHSDIKGWARENREALVKACLTIVLNWINKGKPNFSGEPLGSFESWCRVMGGVIESAGFEGFLANRESAFEEADAEGGEWFEMVEKWWEENADEVITVTALTNLCKRHGLLNDIVNRSDEHAAKTSMGAHLARQKGRVYGDYRIELASSSKGHGRKYRLSLLGKE